MIDEWAALEFYCDLAAELHRPLADILSLPEAELQVWRQYHMKKGLPLARIACAIANVGACLSQQWGGRRRPEDFMPRWGESRNGGGMSNTALIAYLSSRPGAKVEIVPRGV